jgi:hypothetical protein
MTKPIILFSALLLIAVHVIAQQKIAGRYDPQIREFYPNDTNILVKPFRKASLAPFMIMGKAPFVDTNNRVGFIDTTGRIIVKPDYINCSDFAGDNALVESPSRRIGVVNSLGELIIPANYYYVRYFPNSLFLAFGGNYNKWEMAFFNNKGKLLVPFGKYEIPQTRPYSSSGGDYYPEGLSSAGKTKRIWILLHNEILYVYKTYDKSKYILLKAKKDWAIINNAGVEISRPKFASIGTFVGSHAPVYRHGKVGVIDTSGNLVIPIKYTAVSLLNNSQVLVSIKKKTGVLSTCNKVVIPIQHEKIEKFSDSTFLVWDKNVCGVFDIHNKLIIQQKYSSISKFFDGYIVNDGYIQTFYNAHGDFVATDIGGIIFKFFLWLKTGRYIAYDPINKKYTRHDQIEPIVNAPDVFRYANGPKWGLIDTSGIDITPAEYDRIEGFYIGPDLIIAKKGDKYGVINKKGRVVINFDFDKIENQFVSVQFGQVWHGSSYSYNKKGVTTDAVIVVYKKKKCAIFYYSTNTLTPLIYDEINLSQVVISARVGKKWMILNPYVENEMPIKYDRLPKAVSDSTCIVNINKKYGLVNKKGEEVLKCVYDTIDIHNLIRGGSNNPREHRLLLKLNNKYGLCNSSGKTIIPTFYDNLFLVYGNFSNRYNNFTSFYYAFYHRKVGLINGADGKIIIPCEYDAIIFNSRYKDEHYHTTNYLVAIKNGQFGLIDFKGKICLPFIYDNIQETENHQYSVKLNGKPDLLDKDLKPVVP